MSDKEQVKDELEFNIEVRQVGKHWSRGLRRDARIPAVIYGPKVKNSNISLIEKEVVKYSKSRYDNAIFVLKSKDSALNNLKVLKKATAVHPVSRRPVHLDLFAIDLTKVIRVAVEVRFEGRSVGVKEGGILNAVKREVEVECLPTQIPQFLAVDITALGINDSMHVSELKPPEGVKIITLPTETLCTVTLIAEEVVVAPVAAAAVEGAAPADGAAPGAAPAAGAAAAPGAAGAKKDAAPAAGKKEDKK
jgi:large subunit ribosomal protein L25